MRSFVIFIYLLIALPLQAQSSKEDSVAHKNIKREMMKNSFQRVIKKFFDFTDYDTAYVSPNRYNYAFIMSHISNFEYYSVTSDLPHPQRLSFSPNPLNKVGVYLGWQWIFLGWAFDVDDIFRKTNRKNKGTEFDLSLYSSKLGLDIFYRRTGNNYKVHKLSGFSENIPSDFSVNFDGLKVDIRGLNIYYIFNNRRFSYPAAFSQSTNQRRNAGSMIVGLSFSKHKLDFDYTRLPDFIQQEMNPEMKVEKIKYTNANLSFGYAYNWVFARNFLACISLTPAIAYKASNVNSEVHEPKWYGKFNLDFLIRAGIVYNNDKYYAGASFLGKNYNYHRNNFSLDNGFGTLQIYAGLNFNLKKQYRKKK